ncbi:kinase domain protein [Ancylostoma duodenale]|uniref:Kinase domain protein n=1 Tax=Ancylostoma duodenale TaxID=51022 RepID=A0A0C2H4U8_9BILA|nr:kinase domain protein [Ancylostoma duodenale]
MSDYGRIRAGRVRRLVKDYGLTVFPFFSFLSAFIQKFVAKFEVRKAGFPFQCSIFRVLRLLFSMERNRGMFKKVFPTAFFEQFIDIGHYVQDLSSYRPLVTEYCKIIDTSSIADLNTAWESVNQKRDPIGRVADYELLEQLGAGAFGCVYTARKSGASATNGVSQYYALKEIFMVQLGGEQNDKSFGDVISEVKIIKQQLRHPNIVRYRKIFVENHRLYILMDLIEGTSLKEHITSVREKRQSFPEDRIWNMVIQTTLALRYLHKDKQIVHRDLKPNNIMIAEKDRVVITDFGLAKKRGSDYLKSAAGTIIYSCPEIVQNMGYGEKADVWSFGCCIYEMAALRPPFYSQNMLALATQIVEGKYEPLSSDRSSELSLLISSCLTVSASTRPDIVEVARIAAPHMLLCLDDIFRIHVSKGKVKEAPPIYKLKRNKIPAFVRKSTAIALQFII